MSMDKNFSMGLQGGGQPAAGDDKPAAVIDSIAGIFGINPRAAKGIDNFDAKGFLEKKIAVWGSAPDKDRSGIGQKFTARAHGDLKKMNDENFPKGSRPNSDWDGSGGRSFGGAGDFSLAAVVGSLSLHTLPISGGVSVASSPTASNIAPSAPSVAATMEV